MKTAIIVPARLASQRFPRKLLHLVDGKPIVLWTAERIRQEAPEYPLYFAVGEPELAETLSAAGYETVLTDPDLPSGTDRIAAANETIGADRVLNVQADEPLISGTDIRLLDRLLDGQADLATVATPFHSAEEFADSARVKVVCGRQGHALYFSRAGIPFERNAPADSYQKSLRHIGLYGYTAAFLRAFAGLPVGTLEQIEKLEQLRALENGYRIAVGIVDAAGIGIDTPADLEAFTRARAAR